MAGWRGSTSEQAQDDLDELLNAALGNAENELTARGEFYPFAVARTLTGETQLVGTGAESDRPSPDELLGRLWGVLQDNRDSFRAAGVVSDRTDDGADLVAVQLEHAEGTAIEVTLQYRLDGQRFEAGDLTAGLGVARVW